jgi:hypothetical protein
VAAAEPMTDCAAHRAYLSGRFALPHALAQWWLLAPTDALSKDASSVPARDHVASCAACRDWLDTRIPADIMRRQARLSRYCCAGMFVAVEEADAGRDVVMAFAMIRDEPCWMIDGKQTYAAHCPWCGKVLPDRPFIEQEDGRRA